MFRQLLTYNIFISYAGEDNNLAQLLYDSLGRIVQFRPYKSENYLSFQEGFKQRIQNELINSFFVIALLTENGKSSQFVNQELGFALAVKVYNKAVKAKLDPNKDIPIIIPVSQKKVELKGFLTKDSNDLLFLEKYPSLELFVTEIIACIRHYIPEGEKEKTLTMKVTCPECHQNNGSPLTYETYLPKVKVVWDLIRKQASIKSECPKCHGVTLIDAKTLVPTSFLKAEEADAASLLFKDF
jgi:hypothetical protein